MIVNSVKQICLFSIGIVILFSCKKHRLKDEKSILVGEWEWAYSIKEGSMTSPPFASYTDTIFPSDVSSTYGLTFLKKGKVQLIENNEIKVEYRTVFNKFEDADSGPLINDPKYFEIDLNNEWDNFLDGWVNSDSLSISDLHFPFPNEDNGSSKIRYRDVFIKIN